MITILRNPEITDKLVYELKEDDVLKGSVTAVLSDDLSLTITDLCADEEIFYDGLCRAILSYACCRGIDKAVFAIDDDRKRRRLKGFGFITDESSEIESINRFFEEDDCK